MENSEYIVKYFFYIKNKTKEALASVSSNVKCQIECEEILKRKTTSPIADIVGLPTYGLERLKREHIVDMNIGQLQVSFNKNILKKC